MFKAHQGSVWKLSWAHPEFGQIIATCSFDRTVSIWEEQNAPHAPSSADSWRNHAQLVDSRESIHDVQFAPRHLGLRLVRIIPPTSVKLTRNYYYRLQLLQMDSFGCMKLLIF